MAIHLSGAVEDEAQGMVERIAEPRQRAHRLLSRLKDVAAIPVRRGGLEAVKKDMRQHMAELRNVYHTIEGAGINVKGLRARQAAVSELVRNARMIRGGLDVTAIRGALRPLHAELDALTNYYWQIATLTTAEQDAPMQMKTLKTGLRWFWRHRMIDKASGLLTMFQMGKEGGIHAHGLFYGRRLHEDLLRDEWANLTGATSVHCDALKAGPQGVARWVRYGMGFGTAPPEIRAEVAGRLKRRRWLEWQGSCRTARTAVAAKAEQRLPLDLEAWPLEWRERYDERAAIMMHDGGLLQLEAERHAEEILRANHTQHHEVTR